MPMPARNNSLRNLVASLIGLLLFGSSDVYAQYGFGFGFGGNQLSMQTQGEINSFALQQASKATMGPKQNNVYANNPNAYINRMREPGLLDKWDVDTRRTIEASIGRYSDGPTRATADRIRQRERERALAANTPSPGAQTPAKPLAPLVPLDSFFYRGATLVWPEIAPIFGKYEPLKATSDLAALATLNEYNLRGRAQVSTVTDARAKLLAYGQPALQYVRDNSTAPIADSFHQFLLSLYESLAQAATVPRQPAPAQAAP